MAHNHEVAGSSPVPATKVRHPRKWVFYFGSVAGSTCDQPAQAGVGCRFGVGGPRAEASFEHGLPEKGFSPLSCPYAEPKKPNSADYRLLGAKL